MPLKSVLPLWMVKYSNDRPGGLKTKIERNSIMPTKTIIYRFCLAKEDHKIKEQKALKKALKRRFKTALDTLDTITLEDQERFLKALLEA